MILNPNDEDNINLWCKNVCTNKMCPIDCNRLRDDYLEWLSSGGVNNNIICLGRLSSRWL